MKLPSTLGRHAAKAFLSLLLVSAVTVLMNSMRDRFSTAIIALIFLLSVVLSTTLWGMWVGIFSSFAAFLEFNYFFFPPYYSFAVGRTEDIIVLVVFLAVAMVISNLVGREQKRYEEVQARERDATHLYELSIALTGLKEEKEIANVLVGHLIEIFQAARVEVVIQDADGKESIKVSLPKEAPALFGLYLTRFPLNTHRGDLGEIQLWTQKPGLSTLELHLLQTIASQAALSIERVYLSKAETRAKILEESDQLKTALLSSVSHDLRTPLASIEASATTLFNPQVNLEPEARVELQTILVEETEHLNQLVGNLLNMSRIESGVLKLQRNWNSLSEIVEAAFNRMRRQSRGFILENEISDDLPLIPLDSVLMEQVLINLISNSLKYAPKGSQICIEAHQADTDWVEVTLTNYGPHIPAEYLDHIFDKFYSFPNQVRVSGTGLGLSICKGIVEAHGGMIWVANLAEGIAFHMKLPIRSEGFQPSKPLKDLEI